MEGRQRFLGRSSVDVRADRHHDESSSAATKLVEVHLDVICYRLALIDHEPSCRQDASRSGATVFAAAHPPHTGTFGRGAGTWLSGSRTEQVLHRTRLSAEPAFQTEETRVRPAVIEPQTDRQRSLLHNESATTAPVVHRIIAA
jgi:hypothetical protein